MTIAKQPSLYWLVYVDQRHY